MKNLILITILILSIGCTNDDDTITNSPDLELIKEGIFSAENEILAKQNWIIESQSELETVFSNEQNFLTFFQENPFNFNTHVMLISSDEIKTSGGYSVDIQVDRETETIIFLNVLYNTPQESLVTLPVYIPYQVKQYPKTEKSIQFNE
ncbi:hypothetical protein [Psychroflexus tropicus]|uniref:hypothetical protein n=1 Tax=Psychroflexus tropicus TaxID=197345 RepID=UPI0003A26919|nr:hypothetical protein [Psychroflexus tropicus]